MGAWGSEFVCGDLGFVVIAGFSGGFSGGLSGWCLINSVDT